MIPKVPAPEDQDVSKLIEAIGIDAQPIYVAVKPDSRALINECFPNVAEKIKSEGGSQIVGWQIWKTQNLIEAEFHAVWRSDNNELLDITPKPVPFSEILFLEDKGRVYSRSQVDNIRINISGNSLVDDLISVCEMLFKIENKGSRAYEYQLALSGEELKIWEILQEMKKGLSLMLSQGLTKHQGCFCGRDKYRKCHGKFLPYVQGRV
ncbi:MAG: hypothetical protein M0Q44_15000 [Methylobacter sp.]|jgi:hypothetical protein|nr:hypothetical protein [Methylobacter sp.]